MQIKYTTFEVSIANKSGLTFVEVVACDIEAAYADVRECYGADVEIVSIRWI